MPSHIGISVLYLEQSTLVESHKAPTTAGTIPEMTSLADRIKRSGNPSPVITLTTDKGDKFQGQALGGKANGLGKMTYVCGDVYQGYFVDGHPHGAISIPMTPFYLEANDHET